MVKQDQFAAGLGVIDEGILGLFGESAVDVNDYRLVIGKSWGEFVLGKESAFNVASDFSFVATTCMAGNSSATMRTSAEERRAMENNNNISARKGAPQKPVSS